jgi:selenocysteine lyase/cysteine desulfurase
LLECLKKAPESAIYHHTHRFLQQHQYLSPEPPNDFAYWVSNVLGDRRLGEHLASIDTIGFNNINDLRHKFISVIKDYLKENPSAKLKFANDEESLYFVKSISFIFPTNYLAYDLAEFLDILKKITIDSVYFHIFEARLRLAKGTNDFSKWIKESIGEGKLANDISKLDPYSYTLEELKDRIIKITESRLGA